MATMRERQRQVQLYRGQIPSPGGRTHLRTDSTPNPNWSATLLTVP